MAPVAFGFNAGWTSPYLPYLLSNASPIPTTQFEGAWCATGHLGGCVIGAVLAANIADRIGRKASMLSLAPLTFVGFVGMAFVNYIWYLIAFKFLIGITDGALFTILPMYIGEIADAEIRGFLSSLTCIMFIVGLLLINVIGPVMSIFQSSLIACVIPAIHFVSLLLIPESPYHLVKRREYDKAKHSLVIFKGEDRTVFELDQLREFIAKEEEMITKLNFTNLFTIPSNRKACLIFILLLLANKFSGKSAIMFYTTTIFLESGSSISPVLSVILYTAVELLVVFCVTFFIIDRFGRRPLMLISCYGSTLTILALGTYFFFKDNEYSFVKHLNWLPITSLISYNILFSIGLGFGSMTYLSELFPMDVKSSATCMAEIITVILSFVTSLFFQMSQDHFGMCFPFLMFAFCCGICVIFIYKFVPETKGKSLMEIQEILMSTTDEKSTKKI